MLTSLLNTFRHGWHLMNIILKMFEFLVNKISILHAKLRSSSVCAFL